MLRCRICDHSGIAARFLVREMMFGFGDGFEYCQCSRCGGLNLAQPPDDISKYYPPEYYSYARPNPNGLLKRFLKRHWARSTLGSIDPLGVLLRWRYGIPPELRWVVPTGVKFDDAVLDVGCGAGHLLYWLAGAGFSNLTGIDPFVPGDLQQGKGLRILREAIADHGGLYDFIILNHSLEHTDDPVETLRHVRRLLRSGRLAMVRLPLADSHACRAYGPNWVAFDAPRHFFLPTEEGIGILANRAGLAVTTVTRDSTALQFWGSEQYKQGIPLCDMRSYGVNPQLAPFSADDIRTFELKASQLNTAGDGDQACFYLRSTESRLTAR